MKPTVTREELAACLTLLQQADGPMTAIELAEKLGLGGCRETKRRHVREILTRLREGGHWIVGLNPDGNCLTHDPAAWKAYCEGRISEAKRRIGQAHKRKKAMVADASGQGVLFAPRPCMGGG